MSVGELRLAARNFGEQTVQGHHTLTAPASVASSGLLGGGIVLERDADGKDVRSGLACSSLGCL